MATAVDDLYKKILEDVDRHMSGSNKVVHTNSEGNQIETVFRIPPTPDELEGLLIWLNKENIPQA